jgi:hypothetical protein
MLKRLVSLCVLMVPFCMAAPEGMAPEGFQLWTPAALGDGGKVLSTKAASDPHHAATQQLASYNNEYFLLAHREADGVVEWHETERETRRND